MVSLNIGGSRGRTWPTRAYRWRLGKSGVLGHFGGRWQKIRLRSSRTRRPCTFIKCSGRLLPEKIFGKRSTKARKTAAPKLVKCLRCFYIAPCSSQLCASERKDDDDVHVRRAHLNGGELHRLCWKLCIKKSQEYVLEVTNYSLRMTWLPLDWKIAKVTITQSFGSG